MPLRIAAASGGDFGLPAFAALRAAGHALVLLVTPPPRPAGRGRELQPCPAQAWGEQQGVPLLATADINAPESIAALRAVAPDLFFVVDFGQILSAAALAVPRLAAVNLHGSLLPAWRGAEPIRRALLAGDRETGVTAMLMDEHIDTGGMLRAETVAITPRETYGTLRGKLAALGAEVMVRTVAGLADGTLRPRAQDDRAASLARKLRKEERVISWTQPATALDLLVRALQPAPGAYTLRAGKRLTVGAAQAVAGSGTAGTVVSVAPLRLGTGDGLLEIAMLQPEGKTMMTAAAFARGYRPAAGEVWGA